MTLAVVVMVVLVLVCVIVFVVVVVVVVLVSVLVLLLHLQRSKRSTHIVLVQISCVKTKHGRGGIGHRCTAVRTPALFKRDGLRVKGELITRERQRRHASRERVRWYSSAGGGDGGGGGC